MFPSSDTWPGDDLVGIGGDLEPATVLAAYRLGLFPMPLDPDGMLGWWSPLRRGVLEPGRMHLARSLRRTRRRFRIRFDSAFEEVVDACADPARAHGWIDARMRQAYVQLHAHGIAHSVEAWDDEGLAGGLFGLSVGGLFAAESMFTRRTDAAKAVLAALSEHLDDGLARLVDVQWQSDHLRSLGVTEIPRRAYLARLAAIVETPEPHWPAEPARRPDGGR